MIPEGLSFCEPESPRFPFDWKETYFRIHFDHEAGGYRCPNCGELFTGVKGLRQLEGDHRHPRKHGGLTIWENLQLLCWQCNNRKSANLP